MQKKSIIQNTDHNRLILQILPTPTQAHDVRETQTLELDITPTLIESRMGSHLVEITEDRTTIDSATMPRLTTQDVLLSQFNFSNGKTNPIDGSVSYTI